MKIKLFAGLILLWGLNSTVNAQLYFRGEVAAGHSISSSTLVPFQFCLKSGLAIEYQRSDSSFIVGFKCAYFFLQPELDHMQDYRQWQWGAYIGKQPIRNLRSLRFSTGLLWTNSMFNIKDDFFPDGVNNTGSSYFSQWALDFIVEYKLLKRLNITASITTLLPREYSPSNMNTMLMGGVSYSLNLVK